MAIKKRVKGETYRPIVTVEREKDGLPTRVHINGQEYHAIARPESYKSSQFDNARTRRKKRRAAECAEGKGETG